MALCLRNRRLERIAKRHALFQRETSRDSTRRTCHFARWCCETSKSWIARTNLAGQAQRLQRRLCISLDGGTRASLACGPLFRGCRFIPIGLGCMADGLDDSPKLESATRTHHRAGRITVGNGRLKPQPAAAATPELRPLTHAIETLIFRLHAAFASQREFTSDLAHELKTAVAIIKSSLQVLLQAPRTAREYRAGTETLLGDCERLESLVEECSASRAQSNSPSARQPSACPPTDLMSTCEAAARPH